MWRVHRLQFSTYRKVVAEKWMEKKHRTCHTRFSFFSPLKFTRILHISVEFLADKYFETMLSAYTIA